MNLDIMGRREKFKYLTEKGIDYAVTMTNKEIDALCRGETVKPKKKRRSARKGRIPLGGHRSKLSIDGYDIPEDKVARWVNDHPGRLDAALQGGYTFVKDPKREVKIGEDPLRRTGLDTSVTAVVGTKEGGEPLSAYLMVIDKDLYDEDQAEKNREMDKIDDAVRRGVGPGTSEEGMYAPGGGIKYEP
ncbi:MAG: hypothetical protein ACW99G_19870 [Candidatus Thorarchaeota archaeon]